MSNNETEEDSQVGREGQSETREDPPRAEAIDPEKVRKVFIAHGKNQQFLDPIKKLLTFGEMEAVVSVEKQSVSQPVSDKVMNDMRSCGAAIIMLRMS